MTQNTQHQPQLFDRQALAAHRARRQQEALFLHQMARDEVEDRLSMVNRTFTAPAVVSPLRRFGTVPLAVRPAWRTRMFWICSPAPMTW